MTVLELQRLPLGTLRREAPFDQPFTEGEAEHIACLLSDPSVRGKVGLKHFSREGFDGETFHYAGIRPKAGEGYEVPDSFRRVYQGGLVYLGFITHPPESLDFIRAMQTSGIEVDQFLLSLIRS